MRTFNEIADAFWKVSDRNLSVHEDVQRFVSSLPQDEREEVYRNPEAFGEALAYRHIEAVRKARERDSQ